MKKTLAARTRNLEDNQGLNEHESAGSRTVHPAVDESPLVGPIAGHRESGPKSSTATARARSNKKERRVPVPLFDPEMTEDFAL